MYYKIDINGFYLGIKSEELPENWLFNTTIDLPNNLIKPRILNNVWTETFEPEIEVPEKVPLWCVKAILHEMNLLQTVEVALTQLEEPMKSRANYIWNYGNIIKRDSQTVYFIGQVLQKSKIEIDEIFINADIIEL